MTDPLSKDDAQERADQIAAFRAEVERLATEGVVALSDEQRARVAAHHDAILARLADEFDVDLTTAEKQMSVGMRLASFFGAATLTAAVVSFVYRVWGGIPTLGQVALLTAAPLIALAAMIVAGRVERTRYVAALLSIVACAAFVVQTLLIRQIFNVRDTPHVLGVWAAFALAVALPWRFALPFALGVAAVASYAAALLFWIAGVPWTEFMERPEAIMIVAAALIPLAARLPAELTSAGRAVLLALSLFALLVLSSTGRVSLMPFDDGIVKVGYELAAAVVACGVIGIGLRKAEDEIVVIGSVFGAVFLIIRFIDWWWDWMPKYLFFLILASVALAWLWALRVARRHLAAQPS
jgi:hypothetical protein